MENQETKTVQPWMWSRSKKPKVTNEWAAEVIMEKHCGIKVGVLCRALLPDLHCCKWGCWWARATPFFRERTSLNRRHPHWRGIEGRRARTYWLLGTELQSCRSCSRAPRDLAEAHLQLGQNPSFATFPCPVLLSHSLLSRALPQHITFIRTFILGSAVREPWLAPNGWGPNPGSTCKVIFRKVI